MPLFRKKPVVIEAVQYTGRNLKEIMAFSKAGEIGQDFLSGDMVIKTLEGTMNVIENDWVIKGINGEFYPCKPDIFDKTYEEVK